MNAKKPHGHTNGTASSAGNGAASSSSAWDARYAEAARSDSSVWSLEPNAFVASVVAGFAPGTAIDLACGEGRNALWLAQRGWQVTAVDFSAVAVEAGRRRADHLGLEVNWVVADVTDWVPPALVDLIVIAYLQLPAAELASVIATCAGSLEPEGLIVLVAHDLDNLERGVGGPQNPAVLTSVDSLRAAAADVEIERCEQVLRPVGDAHAVDTVLIARRS
ncbi:SAM-dependent methyltransferase [Marisediminicola sp. UYEF4]|uniref:class I SAM-dependent methyltransferase n=1 Tax=Marisediminicola sp. UYEF4 TaxID=1756384 RepID=UPI003393C47C